ncbi:unnamed protein product [Adineta ricciae]|uniref:Protein-S-isoprenylcysteine O-methyltransferase n=1 Tax=Adineta ricciae TaxID=249248 RepID=A0A814TSW4_ADIRI|nr:unnamed protein product [Adineta ricciae]CAF1565231.1 unnamed protein product [Adineta ricciae]
MAFDFDLILFLALGIPGLLLELFKQFSKISSSKTDPHSKSKDHGTFHFIWLIVICSMGASIHFVRLGYGLKIFSGTFSRCIVAFPISFALIMTGHLIRRQAIQQLGEWFTMTVRVNDKQPLIQSGWYAKMRHPSYTGVLMVLIGLGLLINNWLGLFGIVIPPTLIFLYRIYIEEKELRAHFGTAYAEYTQKVPAKLFPHLF